MQLGTIGHIFQPCAALDPADPLEPGGFLAINDPYSGGQHLQDVFIFHPVFVEAAVIGFSASVAHHLDLGSGSPGLNPLATDVCGEGLIIPPMKWNMARDWHGGNFERLLRANVRVPHQTMGDFDAQMAANAIGAQRMQELAARYGTAKLRAVMAALLDYSEKRMCAAIRAVPDGVYVGKDAVDDDGTNAIPLPVRATVTVAGATIAVYFTGTSPQVGCNLNAPLASAVSATLSAIKAALTDPDVPFNAGAFRPVSITVASGSLLNPCHPAPVRARMEACYRAWDAVMKALSQAVPGRVAATGFDTTTVGVLSQLGPAGWSVYLEIYGGGLGFRCRFLITGDGIQLSLYSDRFRRAPEGLFGGGPGITGHCRILRVGATIDMLSKGKVPLLRDDVAELAMGGGAGYGDAARRPADRVAADRQDGYLTR